MAVDIVESTEQAVDNATAFVYIRVSSAGQVNTAHDPEGYSIPGQRDECQARSALLGATVVSEYVEYGKSGTNMRRPALQKMLADLPRVQPDYVIVYDLSRIAREEEEAFYILKRITEAGARLESTKERVDDTPVGKLVYGILATVNAFRSRGDAEKVMLGLKRKHNDGGTPGRAPVGYQNTIERVGGRDVRVVVVDDDQARLVRLAFELFATGEYSLSAITHALASQGLHLPMSKKRPERPMGRSSVHRMLRNDYYTGVVTWNGVTQPGRHRAIIDGELFNQVQGILDGHRLSGDRSHKHTHYLKGSLFCGGCGHRLTYGRHRGNGGVERRVRSGSG